MLTYLQAPRRTIAQCDKQIDGLQDKLNCSNRRVFGLSGLVILLLIAVSWLMFRNTTPSTASTTSPTLNTTHSPSPDAFCATQRAISQENFLQFPTFYEYIGIDSTQYPFASFIAHTADLVDPFGDGQAFFRLGTPQRIREVETDMRKALLKAVMEMQVVEHVTESINERCDSRCETSEQMRDWNMHYNDDNDNNKKAAKPSDLLRAEYTSDLVTTKQQRELQWISHIYTVLAESETAAAYNRKFMAPLLGQVEASAGGDNQQWTVSMDAVGRKKWLDMVCPRKMEQDVA